MGVARWPSDLSKDGNWVDSGVLFNTFSLFGSWQICRCLGIIYPLHPISLFLKLVIFRQIPTIHIQITALVNIYSLIQIYSIPNFIQQIMRKKGQSRVRIRRNICSSTAYIVPTKDLQRKDGQRQLICYVSLIRACNKVLYQMVYIGKKVCIP